MGGTAEERSSKKAKQKKKKKKKAEPPHWLDAPASKQRLAGRDFWVDYAAAGTSEEATSDEVARLCAALAGAAPDLRSVDLGGVPLGDAGVEAVADALRRRGGGDAGSSSSSAGLEVLNLSGTRCGDAGACALAACLSEVRVASVDLSANAVTDQGLEWMIGQLTQNALAHVRHLDLSENEIGSGDAIGDFIAVSGLGGVTLTGNCLEAAGDIATVDDCPSLRYIDVRGLEEGWDQLLAFCPNLQWVNGVDWRVSDALLDKLETHGWGAVHAALAHLREVAGDPRHGEDVGGSSDSCYSDAFDDEAEEAEEPSVAAAEVLPPPQEEEEEEEEGEEEAEVSEAASAVEAAAEAASAEGVPGAQGEGEEEEAAVEALQRIARRRTQEEEKDAVSVEAPGEGEEGSSPPHGAEEAAGFEVEGESRGDGAGDGDDAAAAEECEEAAVAGQLQQQPLDSPHEEEHRLPEADVETPGAELSPSPSPSAAAEEASGVSAAEAEMMAEIVGESAAASEQADAEAEAEAARKSEDACGDSAAEDARQNGSDAEVESRTEGDKVSCGGGGGGGDGTAADADANAAAAAVERRGSSHPSTPSPSPPPSPPSSNEDADADTPPPLTAAAAASCDAAAEGASSGDEQAHPRPPGAAAAAAVAAGDEAATGEARAPAPPPTEEEEEEEGSDEGSAPKVRTVTVTGPGGAAAAPAHAEAGEDVAEDRVEEEGDSVGDRGVATASATEDDAGVPTSLVPAAAAGMQHTPEGGSGGAAAAEGEGTDAAEASPAGGGGDGEEEGETAVVVSDDDDDDASSVFSTASSCCRKAQAASAAASVVSASTSTLRAACSHGSLMGAAAVAAAAATQAEAQGGSERRAEEQPADVPSAAAAALESGVQQSAEEEEAEAEAEQVGTPKAVSSVAPAAALRSQEEASVEVAAAAAEEEEEEEAAARTPEQDDILSSDVVAGSAAAGGPDRRSRMPSNSCAVTPDVTRVAGLPPPPPDAGVAADSRCPGTTIDTQAATEYCPAAAAAAAPAAAADGLNVGSIQMEMVDGPAAAPTPPPACAPGGPLVEEFKQCLSTDVRPASRTAGVAVCPRPPSDAGGGGGGSSAKAQSFSRRPRQQRARTPRKQRPFSAGCRNAAGRPPAEALGGSVPLLRDDDNPDDIYAMFSRVSIRELKERTGQLTQTGSSKKSLSQPEVEAMLHRLYYREGDRKERVLRRLQALSGEAPPPKKLDSEAEAKLVHRMVDQAAARREKLLENINRRRYADGDGGPRAAQFGTRTEMEAHVQRLYNHSVEHALRTAEANEGRLFKPRPQKKARTNLVCNRLSRPRESYDAGWAEQYREGRLFGATHGS